MQRKVQSNNTSGHPGVSWHKARRRWVAFIKVNGHTLHLGTFTEIDKAIECRKAAEEQYFGGT